jgi:glyoxylase-like metal-dependent hydrolase (beta-lactamase superfamily II)
MTGRGTNTYILGEGGPVLVVDPGPADDSHLDAVVEQARRQGTPELILITHHHADHSEAAPALARRLGVPVAAFPHPLQPRVDREFEDGETLHFGGGSLRVMHTPGHAADHACLELLGEDTILVGDLVATEGFIVVAPPDGDMSLYMRSLEAVRALGPGLLLPGHGDPIPDGEGRLAAYLAHRLQREDKIMQALRSATGTTPAGLDDLLPLAYDDTPAAMLPVARLSLEAHLLKLVGDGRARRVGDSFLPI